MRVLVGWIVVWLGLCIFAPEAIAQRNASIASELVAEGEVLLAEGDRKAARRKFDEALQYDRRNGAAYRALGELKLREREWKGAIRAFDGALRQDPNDLDARYHRAIANREFGRLRSPLSTLAELVQLDETGVEVRKHYRRAEQDFQRVISQDSAYRDVLHQYALLKQYRNRHAEAIALGHEQVRVRPDMPSAQTGLLRLYRMFTEDERGKAEAWLAEQDSPYARFAEADLLRRADDARAAEEKLIALQQQPDESLGTFPRIAIHTALARIYSSLSNARITESQFWSAANRITSASDAALLMADMQYILSPEELQEYAMRSTPEQWQAFFREAWTKRNPLPASRSNARIQEHYQRLVEAERNFAHYGPRDAWNDPAMAGKLDFGETYNVDNNYNDKGLIYIRHGLPNDRVATIDQNLPSNESWLYRANGNNPRMIFHFMNSGGSNWRLVPVLLYPEMLVDRARWGAPYAHYRRPPENTSPAAQLAAQIAAAHAIPSSAEQNRRWQALVMSDLGSEMLNEAQADVDAGLSSDRYQWTSEVESMPMAFTTAAFRGPDGQALVEVFYALTLAPLDRNLPDADEAVLDLSLVFHNPDWQPVARQRDRKRVPLTRQPGDGVIDGFRVLVPPDSYQVAVHVEPEGTSLLGGFTQQRRIPDFSGTDLMLSDMLVAFQIGAASSSNIFDRGEANVIPNPSYTFTTEQAVYAYFEVYNLTFAADDQTDYVVEYTLVPQQKRRGLFRRAPRPPITLSVPQRSADRSTIEYTEIDVSNADPGQYILRASITDRVTGQTATTERPLLLTEPAER